MAQQAESIGRSSANPRRRIAAALIFGVALLVLGYGFGLRPWLSRSVGEQVAAEIRTQLDGQFTAQLAASLGDPSAAAALPVAPPSVSDSAAAPVANTTAPQGSAPAPGAPAEQGAQAATALAQTLGQAAPAAANEAPAMSSAGAATGNADAPVVAALALTPTNSPTAATALPPTPEPLATAIPRVVAALPPGEVVLREDAVNRRIAERLVGRGPIENAEMRFVPGEMQVNLRILGTDNQISAGLALAGGRVVVRDPTLSGPMALAIAVDDLIDPIEAQVNESLEVTGRNLLAVRIENGQVVVTIE